MKFIKTRDVKSPERANSTDSGIDFYVPNDAPWMILKQGDNVKINMWVKVVVPKWYDLQFVNKSGIASKTGLIVWAQLVDRWYSWELVLNLIATSRTAVKVIAWMKIAQAVIRPVSLIEPKEVSELEYETEIAKIDSKRWIFGFGSTGI